MFSQKWISWLVPAQTTRGREGMVYEGEETLLGKYSDASLDYVLIPCSYLEPDPMLLASTNESNTTNPRFHTLNQAIVQLVNFDPTQIFLPLIQLITTDRGPPFSPISSSRPHVNRFTRNCPESYRSHNSVWGRWRAKRGMLNTNYTKYLTME